VTLFDEPSDIAGRGDLFTVDGLIRLQQLPGVGPQRAIQLAKRFGDWERLATATETAFAEVLGAAGQRAQQGVDSVKGLEPLPEGIQAIGCFDDDWPQWLTDIPRAPAVIFLRGSLPTASAIAVVGTRSPTRFGLRVVERIVEAAADHRVGIVSGLALGIDGAAHQAALRFETATWAVLGGGVDVPSPRQHRELAARILDSGGGLISEQPPGTEPNPQRLASRNRLQAAAARAVVVAQCGVPSGTLHTARFTLEQHRLLVVPRPKPPWDTEPESAGNMALTDPTGCDPAVLHASGTLAQAIALRQPVADLVLHEATQIEKMWS
jgi:DNA processing protein